MMSIYQLALSTVLMLCLGTCLDVKVVESRMRSRKNKGGSVKIKSGVGSPHVVDSPEVDEYLANLLPRISDMRLNQTVKNTFKYTLEHTIDFSAEEEDTFIITGDIKAMWLRDSTNQIQPYLRFMGGQPLKDVVKFLVRRQTKCLQIDFYANAFNKGHDHYSNSQDRSGQIVDGKLVDRTQDDRLWERKWELDSVAHHLKLLCQYLDRTADFSVVDTQSLNEIMKELLKQQRGTYEDIQQNKADFGVSTTTYTFQRQTDVSSETLQWGMGDPARRTGMIRSSFRPSDDASTYQFSIAANLLLQHHLLQLASLLDNYVAGPCSDEGCQQMSQLALGMSLMARQIKEGVDKYGLIHEGDETYLAYEVDGYGGQLFMDDANIPSLLSLPYLGVMDKTDPLYLATRRRLLQSGTNKYFFEGKAGRGIGGVHVGPDMVWPMSILVQGLTATSKHEVQNCLEMLLSTTAGTFMMHESFNKDNADIFTRPEFGWANSLFAEFVMMIDHQYPDLL